MRMIWMMALGYGLLFAAPENVTEITLPHLFETEKKVALKPYAEGVMLLNIWASWCRGCKAEMPLLHRLGKRFAGSPVSVVTVSVDSSEGKARRFLSRLREQNGEAPAFVSLHDKDKTLPEAYDVKAMPTTLIIKQGRVVERIVGMIDESEAERLAGLLEELAR